MRAESCYQLARSYHCKRDFEKAFQVSKFNLTNNFPFNLEYILSPFLVLLSVDTICESILRSSILWSRSDVHLSRRLRQCKYFVAFFFLYFPSIVGNSMFRESAQRSADKLWNDENTRLSLCTFGWIDYGDRCSAQGETNESSRLFETSGRTVRRRCRSLDRLCTIVGRDRFEGLFYLYLRLWGLDLYMNFYL